MLVREKDIFSLHLSAYCCIAMEISDFSLCPWFILLVKHVCTSINQILRCNRIKDEFLQSLVAQNKWKTSDRQSARQRKWTQSRSSQFS